MDGLALTTLLILNRCLKVSLKIVWCSKPYLWFMLYFEKNKIKTAVHFLVRVERLNSPTWLFRSACAAQCGQKWSKGARSVQLSKVLNMVWGCSPVNGVSPTCSHLQHIAGRQTFQSTIVPPFHTQRLGIQKGPKTVILMVNNIKMFAARHTFRPI